MSKDVIVHHQQFGAYAEVYDDPDTAFDNWQWCMEDEHDRPHGHSHSFWLMGTTQSSLVARSDGNGAVVYMYGSKELKEVVVKSI
jgi:hypothetical protein